MKKNRYHTLLFILIGMVATAQIKIGPNLPAIKSSSLLELEDANKGLLLPRVALTSTTSSQPLAGHVLGMIVYNTVTTNDVLPGVYINNGSKWELKGDPVQASETVSGIINTQAQTLGSGKKTFSNDIIVNSNNMGKGFQNSLTNTAIGNNFQTSSASSLNNTALGKLSQAFIKTGSQNTAVGAFSLPYNLIGNNNSAMGKSTLDSSVSDNNTAVGVYALSYNDLGKNNTAMGDSALQLNRTGESNVAVGVVSHYKNVSGSNNTHFGNFAGLRTANNLNNNTFIGYSNMPGYSLNVSNNVSIGYTVITKLSVQVPWTISSDRRWKSNITTSNLGLDFIKKLHPVSYFRKNDVSQQIEYGFIAQELKKTLKKTGISNAGILNKDSNGMYQMRYNDFMAPTVKAIQEQQTIIVSQKTVNNDQQKQIDELRLRVEQFLLSNK